jgi:hypothetical protein
MKLSLTEVEHIAELAHLAHAHRPTAAQRDA